MSTFAIHIQTYQKNREGKSAIVIRLTHKRERAYLKTEYYVTDRQLDKDLKLKDKFLIRQLNDKIRVYEDTVIKLGTKVDRYNATELKEYLIKTTREGTDTSIDFVAFSLSHIEKIKEKQKSRSAVLHRTLNSFVDFWGRDRISISEITSKKLKEFEDYLYEPRTITRKNQYGKDVTYKKEACIPSGVHDYLGNIRTLFNAAKEKYNDEDKGEILIEHNPFSKYKIPKKKKTAHRNLDIETIRKIINCPDLKTNGSHGVNRANFARDVFALSFYLVGINSVDLFRVDTFKDGRITYKRSKTKDSREDEAEISIKVEPEALPLMEKYKDETGNRVFCFYQMYTNIEGFNLAINKGLKQIAESLDINIPLSTYYARHSWATIARNDCDISKDDVHLALNHVEKDMKITDIYIAKSWLKIDMANRKVIDHYLNKKKSPAKRQAKISRTRNEKPA